MKHFFGTSRLPRCVNVMSISLVPHMECHRSMSDFRPISCCNVLGLHSFGITNNGHSRSNGSVD